MSKPESEYLFVEVAAQRCLQLMRGARPKIETEARKYSTLAIDEVEAGVVPWRLGEEESVPVSAGSASADAGDGEEE
jgi:DNA-directed RNA polymerase subunit K/omega